MGIRDVQSRNIGPADEPHGPRSAQQAPATPSGSDRSDDGVALSARAHALQEARRAALDVPEVRTERVEALRRTLARGSAAVDPKRIARALLDQGIVSF